jgi:uncharacterized membrane protein YfcA
MRGTNQSQLSPSAARRLSRIAGVGWVVVAVMFFFLLNQPLKYILPVFLLIVGLISFFNFFRTNSRES